jgi:hypothetical protein
MESCAEILDAWGHRLWLPKKYMKESGYNLICFRIVAMLIKESGYKSRTIIDFRMRL